MKILGFFVRITKKSNNTTIYDEKKPCKSLFLRAPNRGKNPRQQKGRLFLEPSKRLRVISCAGAMPVRRLKHEKTPDVLGHFLICACPSKLKMPPHSPMLRHSNMSVATKRQNFRSYGPALTCLPLHSPGCQPDSSSRR